MVEVEEKKKEIYNDVSDAWGDILAFITQDGFSNYNYYMGLSVDSPGDEFKFICFYKNMMSVPEVHNFNNGLTLEEIFNEENYNEKIIKIFTNVDDFENSFKFTFEVD